MLSSPLSFHGGRRRFSVQGTASREQASVRFVQAASYARCHHTVNKISLLPSTHGWQKSSSVSVAGQGVALWY